MDKKAFVKRIQFFRSKLNIALFLQIWIFALGVGALVGIIFQIIAFCVPFYYANFYSVLAVLLGTVCALAAVCFRRKTMKQAALYMDSFGFQERIVTAYEHLEEEGDMVLLQRKDAMERLNKKQDEIEVKFLPGWRKMAFTVGVLVVMCVLMLMPSDMKKQAKELHLVKEEALEKEKELEEVLEGLEELTRQDELTPEQLAELQEMMESLQSSMQEYKQVTSPESLANANQKLDYKYNNMSEQLGNMANMLQNSSTVSPQSLQAMQNMANQMQQNSNNPSKGNTSLAGNQNQGSNNNGNNNSNNNGNNNQQNSGQNGNQQNSGQSGNNQSGQNGNNQNNGQNGGQNGQGNNQSGNSQGNGQGSGQGSGQGNEPGSGNGEGSGGGRGEGSSSAPHDYVSIPNKIADSGNLTGNATNQENSDYFRAQNGLSWEGTHVSYETVIGSYEQNAYEGIAAGKYPSGMEDVIKEYFASFN